MSTRITAIMLLAIEPFLAGAGPASSVAAAEDALQVGAFSRMEGDLPSSDWKALPFRKIERQTEYSLVREDGVPVVKAVSRASASGLIRQISIDPREYPIVEWRWKISNVLEKADVTRKEGDDYPARLYITFAYDSSKVGFLARAKYEAARLYYGEYPPSAAINYIWEAKAAEGAVVPNPYTDRTMMIVVESGREEVGRWVSERRDLLEDYRRAFGADPAKISGVAVMTDTDDTGESATAFYGDIVFRRAGE